MIISMIGFGRGEIFETLFFVFVFCVLCFVLWCVVCDGIKKDKKGGVAK